LRLTESVAMVMICHMLVYLYRQKNDTIDRV
jgi:hypothetical protein